MTGDDTDRDAGEQSSADEFDQQVDDADIEQRVEELEDEVVDIDMQDIEERLTDIKARQKRLEENFDALADRTRKESELTPHIDSVKQLYLSLEEIEERISQVQEQLEELTEEVEFDSE